MSARKHTLTRRHIYAPIVISILPKIIFIILGKGIHTGERLHGFAVQSHLVHHQKGIP